MDVQQASVLAIVAIAAAYLARNVWAAYTRFRASGEGGCATGCGKCAYAADPPEKNRKNVIAVINANERE